MEATVKIELTDEEIQAIVVGLSGEGNPEDSIEDCLYFHIPKIHWSYQRTKELIERLLNESQGLR